MITTELVEILGPAFEGIKKHSRHEKTKGGYEAVGFMAGRKKTGPVTTLAPLRNHCADPKTGYFVEPWDQYAMETKLAGGGYKIVGVYHSHPNSEAIPSLTDAAMARPGELMAIYSVVYDELTIWREDGGELLPVELVIV